MPCLFDRLIRGGSIGLLVAVDVECRLTRLKGYHNVEMSAIKLPLPPDHDFRVDYFLCDLEDRE